MYSRGVYKRFVISVVYGRHVTVCKFISVQDSTRYYELVPRIISITIGKYE